jgi:hypothetical protein
MGGRGGVSETREGRQTEKYWQRAVVGEEPGAAEMPFKNLKLRNWWLGERGGWCGCWAVRSPRCLLGGHKLAAGVIVKKKVKELP